MFLRNDYQFYQCMHVPSAHRREKRQLSLDLKNKIIKCQKRRERAGSKMGTRHNRGWILNLEVPMQFHINLLHGKRKHQISPLLSCLLCPHLLSFSVWCWRCAAETQWLLQEKTHSSESRHESSLCPVYAEYQIKKQTNKNRWPKSKCLPQFGISAVKMWGWHQVSPKREQMPG